jgi:serine/threonine protein kinase
MIDPPRAEPPKTFGNYEIATGPDGQPVLLGEGAFGRTFLARHPMLGKDAAIKVIGEHHLHRAGARETFLTEARNAAQLEHPNIARVLDSGESGGTLYYVMDFCRGGDLQRLCERHGSLPAAWLVEVLRQTLAALDCAHRRNYVHRDIKPSNIMMASEELPPVFKLIDFGLTKNLLAEDGPAASMDGKFKGTLLFASPEQLRERPVDMRSDLFALGMTVWFLALGRAPLEDGLAQIIQERLAPQEYQSRLPADLPPPLRAFLGRMLRKDPAQRTQSAAEALQMLAAIEPQIPRPATPAGWKLAPAAARPPATAAASMAAPIKPVPQVEVFDSPFRARYGHGLFEETDAGEGVLLGKCAAHPADGKARRLLVLTGRDDESEHDFALPAELALRFGALSANAAAPVERVEMFEDGLVLVMPPPGDALDLMSVLRARGSLRLRELPDFLTQVAAAADAAHLAGLAGVDLAPHNILLEKSAGPQPWQPAKLAAQPLDRWPAFAPLLLPWFPGHGPRAAGAGESGPSVLQSFAALCYRLLSGRVPPAAAFHAATGFVPVHELSEPGNRALADALAGGGRCQSCDDLINTILASEKPGATGTSTSASRSGALPQQPSGEAPRVLGTAVSVTQQLPPTPPRAGLNPLVWALPVAALLALAVLGGGGYFAWQAFKGAGKTDNPPAQPGRTTTATNPGTGSGGNTPPPPPPPAAPPAAYVVRGGLEPAIASVSLNGALAELKPTGVDGVAVAIKPGTTFPLRFTIEAQGYQRHEFTLQPGDSFERADRLVLARTTAVVDLAGAKGSDYQSLLFKMLRPLEDEPDVPLSATPVEVRIDQRSSVDLPTGIYRATAGSPVSRQVAKFELPGEIVVSKRAPAAVALPPSLAGRHLGPAPAGLPLPDGATTLLLVIPPGYSAGSLSAGKDGRFTEVALLDRMRFSGPDGLAGDLDPLPGAPAPAPPALRFRLVPAAGGPRLLLEPRAGGPAPAFPEVQLEAAPAP